MNKKLVAASPIVSATINSPQDLAAFFVGLFVAGPPSAGDGQAALDTLFNGIGDSDVKLGIADKLYTEVIGWLGPGFKIDPLKNSKFPNVRMRNLGAILAKADLPTALSNDGNSDGASGAYSLTADSALFDALQAAQPQLVAATQVILGLAAEPANRGGAGLEQPPKRQRVDMSDAELLDIQTGAAMPTHKLKSVLQVDDDVQIMRDAMNEGTGQSRADRLQQMGADVQSHLSRKVVTSQVTQSQMSALPDAGAVHDVQQLLVSELTESCLDVLGESYSRDGNFNAAVKQLKKFDIKMLVTDIALLVGGADSFSRPEGYTLLTKARKYQKRFLKPTVGLEMKNGLKQLANYQTRAEALMVPCSVFNAGFHAEVMTIFLGRVRRWFSDLETHKPCPTLSDAMDMSEAKQQEGNGLTHEAKTATKLYLSWEKMRLAAVAANMQSPPAAPGAPVA